MGLRAAERRHQLALEQGDEAVLQFLRYAFHVGSPLFAVIVQVYCITISRALQRFGR